MATKKRAPKKPARKTQGSKGRGASSRKKGKTGAVSRLREHVLSRSIAGAALLALGLFFTAAFVSGGGAFLGEVGFIGATYLLGVVGVVLAPLAVLAGALLLIGYTPGRRALGAGLLLVAAATTFAAFLPAALRFEGAFYSGSGGLVGSAAYAAIYSVGGIVGAVLALSLLYIVAASLITGVTFRRAFEGTRDSLRSVAARLRAGRREGSAAARPVEVERRVPSEIPQENPPVKESSAGRTDDTVELEVVMPGPIEPPAFAEQREVVSGEYSPPSPSLLKPGSGGPQHDAEETSRRLTRALADFGVEARVLRAVVGPRVTRYELRLGSGVKVGKVRNLQQDIAYALAATEVRILAPIPGKSAVGVEVPNTRPATVTLGDIFQEYPAANDWALPVGLGKDISGRAVFFDLAEMPHLLVAGTTGSGKSVMLNSLLTSLLLTTDPRRVKMVLVDPKRVELAPFGRIPHLITPVVTDVKKAANALSWAVAEMERRYEVLEKMGVRSLEGYNDRVETPMPYVVVVIDELADLMMAAAAKVEDAVIRLAQKARAVGIHLVVATQRPSVDVITGMIKANIPSRVAFAVSSQVDSRVILDSAGAEALLGMGDMLYKPVSASRTSRVQGAFITESEVKRVVAACRTEESVEPRYVEEVTEPKQNPKENEEPEDDLLPEAASFVVSTQQASVSAVQRRFRVGYSRAGRIIDALERKGVVGPYEGSKSRSVLATELELEHILVGGEGSGEEGFSEEDKPGVPW
ncbi:MAG TPA: DNA translocase FtsK [Rubrobacteraceae bacterium]|nr:DNA translocase FtsK [Rubrobacteraceae bacterium]